MAELAESDVEVMADAHQGMEKDLAAAAVRDDFLRVVVKHDAHEDIYWSVGEDGSIHFSVKCNDFFYFACADMEPVETEIDVRLFDRCCAELKALDPTRDQVKEEGATYNAYFVWGSLLYCSRRRNMRPQKAFYRSIPEELHSRFDACGPEREH